MNITINQLEREATTGIITTVHWGASKTSGDHTANSYGSVGLTAGDNIIPFDNVTEASLDTQLAALATPVSLTGKPWA